MGTIVKFSVRVGPEDGPHMWLANTPDCKLVSDQAEAIAFQVRTSLNPIQQIRVDHRTHEIAGGLNEWLDLQAGIEGAYRRLEQELAKQIWPDGRPAAETPDEMQAQSEAIDRAFQSHDSKLRRGYETMQELASRIAFLAAWPEIVHDPPQGWASLDDKDIPRNVFSWLQTRYMAAVAEALRGKTQPSA